MDNKIYQQVFDEIDSLIPCAYEKLIIYIEVGTASYSVSFYVGSESKYVKCFDLPGASEEAMLKTLDRIGNIVFTERAHAAETWTNMTIVVNGTSFDTDFDYTDLSIGSYQYKKEWRKKYLS